MKTIKPEIRDYSVRERQKQSGFRAHSSITLAETHGLHWDP
jgi:hypothetical protein